MDSFYTLLKHKEEITDLIFVHGFDIPVSNYQLYQKSVETVYKVANQLGKNVLEVETNLRIIFDPYVDWGRTGHGAALATVGHMLAAELDKIYIPASHTYSFLSPCGSHPLLDPLWSSEDLEFVHDGCEATRVDKTRLISNYNIALDTLRVCWQNPDDAYNCGRCEKCIRTMIDLRIVGALDRCTTFDAPLDIPGILSINVDDENKRVFLTESLEALSGEGDKELRNALVKLLEVNDCKESEIETIKKEPSLRDKIKRFFLNS